MAAHTAIARPRSLGGKMSVMIDSVEGMIKAAPIPIAARCRDQELGGTGPRGTRRGEGEDRHPGHQRQLAAEAVAQGPIVRSRPAKPESPRPSTTDTPMNQSSR